MKRFLLTLAISLSVLSLGAQDVAMQVVAPAGGYFSNSTHNVSWTLGEPVIDTWISTAAGIMITSGFQQGQFKLSSTPTNGNHGLNLTLYPNPASYEAFITIQQPTLSTVTITLIDITGRTMLREQVHPAATTHTHPINVSTLRSGMYLITVSVGNAQPSVLKLVKQ